MIAGAALELDEVLARHHVGISSHELAAELDAALSALGGAGSTPLSGKETDFLHSHVTGTAATVLAEWSPEAERQERARVVTRTLTDTVAASISIGEAADRLGVDRSRISHRLRDQQLWSFTLGKRRRVPRWQFISAGQLLPGLDRIIASIPEGIAPRSVEAFMHTAQPDFAGQAPVDYLAAGGDPDLVAGFLADLARW